MRWRRRLPPLDPVAVVATGAVTEALAASTVTALQAGADLRAAAGDGWLLVLADRPDDLPWADGVAYLGRDDGVLVPTTAISWPPAAALRAMLPPAQLVVAMPGHVLVSDAPARAADPARLADSLRRTPQ